MQVEYVSWNYLKREVVSFFCGSLKPGSSKAASRSLGCQKIKTVRRNRIIKELDIENAFFKIIQLTTS